MILRRVSFTAPAIEQLGVAPELVSLAILEIALETTVNALLLAQPELLAQGDLDQRSLPTPAMVASGTISCCLDLVDSINRYRLALSIEQPENDPLPF